MIELITKYHRDLLNIQYKNCKLIKYPERYFTEVSSLLYKKGEHTEIERILKEIEECQYLKSDNLMISKFNGVPLQLSYLSTGSQIVASIYYLANNSNISNSIFDISACGNNAIHYIMRHYNNYDLKMYLGHNRVFGNDTYNFMLNGQPANSLEDIFKE